MGELDFFQFDKIFLGGGSILFCIAMTHSDVIKIVRNLLQLRQF